MASVKITQLPNVLGSQIDPAVDVLPIVRVGADSTDKITVEELATLFGGGGLEGTNYVFVAANGKDVENAAELQAAYDLAKTKADPVVVPINIPLSNASDNGGGNYNISVANSSDQSYFIFGQTYDVIINGTSYQMFVQGIMSNMIFVSGLVPGLSFSSIILDVITYPKITVIAAPGNYNFESTTFLMDTKFIDLVSLDGNRSVVFNSSDNLGTIRIAANNVFVKGIDTLSKPFNIENNLNLLKVENCKGGDYSFGASSFFNPQTISGTFVNCEAGFYSFGGSQGGTTSGTFINCISGESSFGNTASGVFTDCISGSNSFGPGTGSNATGTFTNCKAGYQSFGSGTGIFTNCISEYESFGAFNLADGTYTNCIAGANSFGTNMGPSISGKLYYCRLTSGTFRTVTSGGRTYYCVDGNGDPNNQ